MLPHQVDGCQANALVIPLFSIHLREIGRISRGRSLVITLTSVTRSAFWHHCESLTDQTQLCVQTRLIFVVDCE